MILQNFTIKGKHAISAISILVEYLCDGTGYKFRSGVLTEDIKKHMLENENHVISADKLNEHLKSFSIGEKNKLIVVDYNDPDRPTKEVYFDIELNSKLYYVVVPKGFFSFDLKVINDASDEHPIWMCEDIF